MAFVKDFLSKLEPSQVFILILIGMLSLIYFIYSGKLRVFGKNISVNKQDGTPRIDSNSLILIVSKVSEVVYKQSEIKLRIILTEQMAYTEEKLISFKNLALRGYAEALLSKVEDPRNLNTHQDYQFFSSLTKLAVNEILSLVRAAFLKNHLDSFAALDFEKYIKEKTEYFMLEYNDFIDLMYPSDKMLVSREELREKDKVNASKWEEIFHDVFGRGLKISQERKKEIEKLSEELKVYLDTFTRKTEV